MIQIKKAEKDPKKAMTFPKPGRRMAVIAHIAVVNILEMILRPIFFFSHLMRVSVDDLITSASSSLGGMVAAEVNIWDSSPGKEGFMDSRVSIVTFN